MSKTLIVIRHAHRDKSEGRDQDNGLSKRGRAQAELLKEHFEKKYSAKKAHFLSSPKQRCIETLLPIVDEKEKRIEIAPFLDEEGDLDKKINEFIKRWKSNDEELTVICSHGDLIPRLIEKLIGTYFMLEKGGWIELEEEKGKTSLRNVIQDFKTIS